MMMMYPITDGVSIATVSTAARATTPPATIFCEAWSKTSLLRKYKRWPLKTVPYLLIITKHVMQYTEPTGTCLCICMWVLIQTINLKKMYSAAFIMTYDEL